MNYLSFLATFDQWVHANPDIRSAAMIGTYVRAYRLSEPDVDISIICAAPEVYLDTRQWLPSLFSEASNIDAQRFDELVSVRFQLEDFVVDLHFSKADWAHTPASATTAAVVRAGMTLLSDRDGDLASLQQAVSDNRVINIRNAEITDAPALAGIFYRAVHAIPDRLYTAEQKSAWAPEQDADTKYRWQQRIVDQKPFVALLGDQPAGFISLDPNGLVDMLFVEPNLQGQGIARDLYRQMLAEAKAFGLTRLTVEASDAARPFFEARGFTTVARQIIERRGVSLNNTKMQKTI